MAFAIEIPSIHDNVGENGLNLTLGGVRAYNLTNLHSRKCEEHFKLFIGFNNSVCCNLCISTDGFKYDVKVRTVAELAKAAYNLFGEFNVYKDIEVLNNMPGTMITESQFAQIIGRARISLFFMVASYFMVLMMDMAVVVHLHFLLILILIISQDGVFTLKIKSL